MRGDVPQPVTWTPEAPILVCCSPWIQFESQAWKDMIDEVFTEMVELWNEKHSQPEPGRSDDEVSIISEKLRSMDLSAHSTSTDNIVVIRDVLLDLLDLYNRKRIEEIRE